MHIYTAESYPDMITICLTINQRNTSCSIRIYVCNFPMMNASLCSPSMGILARWVGADWPSLRVIKWDQISRSLHYYTYTGMVLLGSHCDIRIELMSNVVACNVV